MLVLNSQELNYLCLYVSNQVDCIKHDLSLMIESQKNTPRYNYKMECLKERQQLLEKLRNEKKLIDKIEV